MAGMGTVQARGKVHVATCLQYEVDLPVAIIRLSAHHNGRGGHGCPPSLITILGNLRPQERLCVCASVPMARLLDSHDSLASMTHDHPRHLFIYLDTRIRPPPTIACSLHKLNNIQSRSSTG